MSVGNGGWHLCLVGDLIGRSYAPVMNYRRYTTLEPGRRGGKPCIRGLRMTVYDVLDYLAAGMTPEEIVADFPNLTLDDIRACLAYAADQERSRTMPRTRLGWDDAFRRMAQDGDDELLDKEWLGPAAWDKTEWEW